MFGKFDTKLFHIDKYYYFVSDRCFHHDISKETKRNIIKNKLGDQNGCIRNEKYNI